MPIARMVLTDRPELLTLITTRVPPVTGQTIEQELIADFGALAWSQTNASRNAFFLKVINDAEYFPLIFRDGSNVVRGFLIGYKAAPDAPWVISLTAADKTLADAVRLARFADLLRDLAARVIPTTGFAGVVKVNGKIDNHLVARGMVGRTVLSGNRVRWDTTAAEILEKL